MVSDMRGCLWPSCSVQLLLSAVFISSLHRPLVPHSGPAKDEFKAITIIGWPIRLNCLQMQLFLACFSPRTCRHLEMATAFLCNRCEPEESESSPGWQLHYASNMSNLYHEYHETHNSVFCITNLHTLLEPLKENFTLKLFFPFL